MESISVVIPNYNHARFLPAALDSVLSQSPEPREVLVFDDASTDDSVAVIQEYCRRHPNLKLFQDHENQGPVVRMNRGLELAKSRYVFFMAADDVVLPGFFSRSLALLEKHPGAGLCSGLSLTIDEAGTDGGVYRNPMVSHTDAYITPREGLRFLNAFGPWFMGNTSIYRREALLAAGGFDAGLRSFCDGFISQALTLRHGACFVAEPLGCWRRMETGFAHVTGQDWQLRFKTRQYAAGLMRTTFQDAFPPRYVRRWERKNRFTAGIAVVRDIRNHRRRALDELFERLDLQRNLPARCFRSAATLFAGIAQLLLRLFLFLRYRGPLDWMIQRIERWLIRARRTGST